MKSGFSVILIFAYLTAGCAISSFAQPAWKVNPSQYEYSMTVTGKITTNGYFSNNTNDEIAAFVKGECRGIANVVYENMMGQYYVYLMIFSNVPSDTIRFELYDAGKNEVIEAKNNLIFKINDNIGSLDNPLIFSSGKLSSEARLVKFTISGQVGETSFQDHKVYLKKSTNGSLTGLTADFSVSVGAKVYVRGVEQISSVTINDFSKPVEYVVTSADMTNSVIYTVYISVDSNSSPLFLSTPVSYVLQNEVYVYQVIVKDNEGDNIILNIENMPSWLIFDRDAKLISGIPGNEDVGTVNFRIKASDGFSEAVQNVILVVVNVNDPPEIKSIFGNQIFYADQENNIRLPDKCIADPDAGDVLTFSLTTENNSALPAWLKFDPATLCLSGHPPIDACGNYKLKLTATDKLKLKEWIIFDLIVNKATVAENIQSGNFTIYPNPCQDILHIEFPAFAENQKLSILNSAGQLLKTVVFNSGRISVPFDELSPGIYFIEMQQGGTLRKQKIVRL
jgi:hypothetical protein